jgi:CRP/FNR family transcriptional regulator
VEAHRGLGLLDELPPTSRGRLLASAHEIEVPHGGVLYREKDTPRCAVVRAGLVRVFLRSARGRQVTVRYARPGEVLGVAAAVAGPSPVAVEALLDSTLLMFDATALADEARRDARVAWAVAGELGRRLYEALDEVGANAFGSVRERIARHLLDASSPGKEGRLVVAITQQQLADAVGSAREVVARALRALRAEGLVRSRPGGLVLLDPGGLARVAGGERDGV